MATTAVKRMKTTTSKKLLRLLAAIKSRNVVVMDRGSVVAASCQLARSPLSPQAGSLRLRCCRIRDLELHLRRLADGSGLGGIQLKELGGAETKRAGQDVGRKPREARVV